jgi:signal transduction histidine kinase
MTEDNDAQHLKTKRQLGRSIAVIGILVYSACIATVSSRLPFTELLILVALSVYAEERCVKLPSYGFLNPGEGFYLATTCLYGPLAGGILSCLVGLWADTKLSKENPIVLFNFGWALITFGLSGAVYPTLGWVATALFYLMIARTLQAFGQGVFFRLPFRETLRRQVGEIKLFAPASIGFCYLTVLLLAPNPWLALTLVFPVELVVTYVRTRELSKDLQDALREIELKQAELLATGHQAALGVMAAGIAHEINNPLAAAKTNVYVLKAQVGNSSTAPSFELLEKSLGRCQNIVARMLKYTGRSAAGHQACNLEEVLADAVLFCGQNFQEQGIDLKLELGGLPKVKGDPAELVQIFSNLMLNAHDAGATLIKISAGQKNQSISVKVTDNGVGVDHKIAHKIFEPFFTTKAVGSGTGLGLSVARGIARAYGGDLVLLKSSPERTTLELRLMTI